jgi:C1A family cysteine protease
MKTAPCKFKIKGYGWKPDLPDARDKYRIEKPRATPDKVDLRSGFPDPYDQGDLGSCTANAIAGVLEFDQIKQGQAAPFTPSRLFIYYGERVMEGSVSEDAGAMIRDGIKVVAELGAPPEKSWPYVISKFARKPTLTAYRKAKAHQALTYERVFQNLQSMQSCLADGFPFVFGFSVYEGFESKEVAKTGVVNMPSADEGLLGGHAVCAVGYDNGSKRFIVRNSWGLDWGIKGYFTIPFDYLLNKNLADDFWDVRKIE